MNIAQELRPPLTSLRFVPRRLKVNCLQFHRDIADSVSLPNIVAQQKPMAVGALDKSGPLNSDGVRDKCSPQDRTAFGE
jgi:hypothetical protein